MSDTDSTDKKAARAAYYQRNKEAFADQRRERLRQPTAKQQNRETQRAYQQANAEKISEYQRQWRAANKERKAAMDAEYRRANLERMRPVKRAWNAENQDILAACRKKWAEENPDRARVYRYRRRDAASSGVLSPDIAERLLRLQKGKCANCKTCLATAGYHIDHVMPLARGGSNTDGNVQLLCPPCNFRKNAKDPIEWAQQEGRLL